MPVMPYIPPVDKRATSVGILNYIRNMGDADYIAGVPLAVQTTESIQQIGASITAYQPRMNHFIPTLFGQIGKVLIISKSYRNPLAWAKRGEFGLGETIEEVWNGLAQIHQYNPDEDWDKVFKRAKPDAEVALHSINYKKYYPTTINRRELEQAFLSWDNFKRFISNIIARVYDSAEIDEFILYKYVIQTLAIANRLYVEGVPALTADTANVIVSRIRGISNHMQFMSTKYNMAGVPTTSAKEEQYVIMTADYSAKIDVESLARAFNIEYVQFWGKNAMVDSFSPTAIEMSRLANIFKEDPSYEPFTDEELEILDSIKVVIMDKEWFMIFDKLNETQSIFNPRTLEYNYFYHTWKILSASPFANCIVLAEGDNKVTGITISPAAPSVVKGKGGTQLSAEVTGEGLYSQGVEWTVSGNTSKDTYINGAGLIVAAADEEATNITVTARSRADNKISATVSVTVTTAKAKTPSKCPTGQVTK